MKHIILATDVAHHLKIMPELEAMASRGMDLTRDHHRELLLAVCMTACDLSDQTKDWKTTKDTAVSRFALQAPLKDYGRLPGQQGDNKYGQTMPLSLGS